MTRIQRPDENLYFNHPIDQNAAYDLMSMPLEDKEYESYVKLTEWYIAWEGKCYVSFSGGKDSTVLAYLTAQCFMENEWFKTPLVLCFFDTGLEYPEIRDFVVFFAGWLQEQFPKLTIRLDIRKPDMNFRRVIEYYGYPVISKEVSHAVKDARSCPTGKVAARFHGAESTSMIGWKKYEYLLDAPFKIDHRCCDVMKKRPARKYEKETGTVPILATMASESILRKQKWKSRGCNAFQAERPESAPMSFWKENDVLAFIKKYEIPICSVYGDIVEEDGKFKTTGCERTGCMFCCLGATNDKEPTRFQRMELTHPTQYQWMLKPYEEGGLGLQKVLDFLHIPYKNQPPE